MLELTLVTEARMKAFAVVAVFTGVALATAGVGIAQLFPQESGPQESGLAAAAPSVKQSDPVHGS
jgi:hypothetical protein